MQFIESKLMNETNNRVHFSTPASEDEAAKLSKHIEECASKSAEALLSGDLESAEYWHLVARNCKSRIFASAA